jgi:hypothetical protein
MKSPKKKERENRQQRQNWKTKIEDKRGKQERSAG